MIKQIQLRGISRTPSDRGTVDGGCAESINVHLDQNETAPTLPAKDAKVDVYGSATTRYPIRFVHKIPTGGTNYLGFSATSGTNQFKFYNGTGEVSITDAPTVASGETLVDVTSIGNTVVAYTSAKAYYFLYKESSYRFLGNEIPKPKVEVISTLSVYTTTYADVLAALNHGDDLVDKWNAAKNENDENHAVLLDAMKRLWDAVQIKIDEKRDQGFFSAPFFIRYALRLYDDRYIYRSVPILCGASYTSNWLKAGLAWNLGSNVYRTAANLQSYKVRARGSFDVGAWGDVVKSIDFFASTPIYTPNINAGFESMDADMFITFDKMGDGKDEFIKEEVLSKGQFYKIKTIDVSNADDMALLTGGAMTIDAGENVNGDGLLVQERLDDGYRDGSQYRPLMAAHNYNQRTTLVGATETISRGDSYLNGLAISEAPKEEIVDPYRPHKFCIKYKITDSNSPSSNIVNSNENGGIVCTGYLRNATQEYGIVSPDQGDTYARSLPYAWIAFPDTRATEVEISVYDTDGTTITTHVRIPLEKHPLLECAYAFVGFGHLITYGAATTSYYYGVENRVIGQPNKIFQSEFENPWLFPAGGILTFSDKVLDTAMTSVPLSEGQLGQFDVYVFTEGGIRALSVASDGTFLADNAKPNLAGHIALPGTIIPLEQSVVFVTKKGVMLLQGNAVTDLSPNMNGKPAAVDSALATLLSGATAWASVYASAFASETFMAFMQGAKVAYDRNGMRLLFFVAGKNYIYEYHIQTDTWHKSSWSGAIPASIIPLNSYPKALISGTNTSGAILMDFSTILDDANIYTDFKDGDTPPDTRIYGIIMTRPFDLDAPDVRKSLNDLRIRGVYHKGNVRYILQGSFDGLHWQTMGSLRGGSYKLFRLVILTKLNPMERITWVDVDFEPRYNNKLR